MLTTLTSLLPRTGYGQFDVIARIRTALRVQRTRKALKNLDAARLADIGISAADAEAEAARPLWDAPHNWRG